MNFKEWLLENDQGIELQTARFLESMLDAAAALLKQEVQNGQPPKVFTRYLHQVWPQQARSGQGFVLPNTLSPAVAGKSIIFKYMEKQRAASLHQGQQFDGFQINIKNLDTNSISEIDKEIEALKSAVHHETEHIFTPGTNLESENDEKASLDYMNHPGEIKAHAREMARAYAQNFPGEQFDLNKAKTLLNQPYFNQTHKNYFDDLSQPYKWQGFAQKYGYKNNPHEEIISATQRILPQYQV